MKTLLEALEIGKRRGYDVTRQVDSVIYLFQYALKKEKGVYKTYFFKVEASKIDVFEDYADEEIKSFDMLDSALDYLVSKGGEIDKLANIKGTLPF